MPDGRTSFGALQAELKRGSAADLTYHVFDLPYLGGYDLRGAPLRERKRLLERALAPAGPRVRYVDHVAGEGEAFHRQTCAFELEGSVAKRADSVYRSGRGRDWQKRKCIGREDFVVVGYTLPSDGTPGVGALALASRSSAGVLAYAGRVGTGWSADESRTLRTRLEALASDGPSLDVPAADRSPASPGCGPSLPWRSRSPSGPPRAWCVTRRSRAFGRTSAHRRRPRPIRSPG